MKLLDRRHSEKGAVVNFGTATDVMSLGDGRAVAWGRSATFSGGSSSLGCSPIQGTEYSVLLLGNCVFVDGGT